MLLTQETRGKKEEGSPNGDSRRADQRMKRIEVKVRVIKTLDPSLAFISAR